MHVLGHDAFSYSAVKTWVGKFKHGRTSLKNFEKLLPPKKLLCDMDNNRFTMCEIAEVMDFSIKMFHIFPK